MNDYHRPPYIALTFVAQLAYRQFFLHVFYFRALDHIFRMYYVLERRIRLHSMYGNLGLGNYKL